MMKLFPTQETSTLFSFTVSAVQHCQLWLCKCKGKFLQNPTTRLSRMVLPCLTDTFTTKDAVLSLWYTAQRKKSNALNHYNISSWIFSPCTSSCTQWVLISWLGDVSMRATSFPAKPSTQYYETIQCKIPFSRLFTLWENICGCNHSNTTTVLVRINEKQHTRLQTCWLHIRIKGE